MSLKKTNSQVMPVSNKKSTPYYPNPSQLVVFIIFIVLLNGCATFKMQESTDNKVPVTTHKKPVHTFYLAGGYGDYAITENRAAASLLKKQLSTADENTTLLFTGDNISSTKNNWNTDQKLVEEQIALTENFKGKTIFIPGVNEWKSYNTRDVEKVEKYLDAIDSDALKFFPKKCLPY
ncbi:hypothetical protein M601_016640 [Cellulophaga baltica 4]|nr:hypothetical protein M601_016640 [Cellulophaga baltica 4]